MLDLRQYAIPDLARHLLKFRSIRHSGEITLFEVQHGTRLALLKLKGNTILLGHRRACRAYIEDREPQEFLGLQARDIPFDQRLVVLLQPAHRGSDPPIRFNPKRRAAGELRRPSTRILEFREHIPNLEGQRIDLDGLIYK